MCKIIAKKDKKSVKYKKNILKNVYLFFAYVIIYMDRR